MAIQVRQKRVIEEQQSPSDINNPGASLGSAVLSTIAPMGTKTLISRATDLMGATPEEMQQAQATRDRKRSNTLMAEYSYSEDGVNYMEGLGKKDQSLLNTMIEKRNQYIDTQEKEGPQLREYKPEEFDVDLQRKMQLEARGGEGALGEIGQALDLGVGQVMSGVGGALRFGGAEEIGKSFTETGEKRMREVDFQHPITQEFDIEQMGDPRFWTQKFPQSLPFMIAGAETAGIGAGVGTIGAGVVGLGTTATIVTSGVFAGLSSRTFESYVEAGSTYNDALKQGLSEEKASEAGMDVFQDNMKLAVTDAGQFISTFAPIKTQGIYKHLLNTAKIPGNVVVEGLEEVYQGYASENALSIASGKGEVNIDEYLNKPTTAEAFALGGVTGGVFGTAGVVSDYFGGSEMIKDVLKEQKKQLIERAKKGDDNYITDIDASIINGDISQEYGQQLKKSYVRLKDYFLEKAEPYVEKFAEFSGGKINLITIKDPKNGSKSFKDEDGEVLFEIQDDKSLYTKPPEVDEFDNDLTSKLGHILKHDELYKIYPGLKNVEVAYRGDMRSRGRFIATVHKETGNIHKIEIELNKNETDEQQHETLIHEIQHALQNKEGRQGGENMGFSGISLEKYLKSKGEAEARKTVERFKSGDYKEVYSVFINEAVAKYASINKDKILSDNNITSQVEPDELMNLAKDHMERESRIDDIGKIRKGEIFANKEKSKAFKLLTELETIQVAKDETGKFADTQTKADMEELGLDPKDFKDTEQNQRKTEIMKELNEMGAMKGTLFSEKLLNTFKNFKESFPNLGVGTHFPKIEKTRSRKSTKNPVKVYGKTSEKIKANLSQEKGQKIDTKKNEKKTPISEKIKKERADNKLATEIAKISKQPNVNDITKLLNKHGIDIVKQATDLAVQKNMINKEESKFFYDSIKGKTKEVAKAPTGRINNQQRLNILDMLGYDKLFKKAEEFKINIGQLSKSLKEIGARMHIVNAPEGARVKLPFSLMGNKSMTFKNILLPMIKKATNQGAKTYVEPFGGAGTVYYFAKEMIESGIEQLHINHFDKEKYEVVKAIKEGKVNVIGLVDSAYDKIIGEIGVELAHIPEIKEIMDEYGVEVGSKEFKELAELSFYPQYAKQFFEERPDTKLAIKGETTTTFREWLKEHLSEEAKKNGKVLEGNELDTATELVLNDRTVFENRYPEISKKISTVLDKYDDINIKPGDVESAMLVSMSRHFRQRGDSGQKVVSASSGFQNVVNVRNKMIDGLTKYQKVFEEYGDKINIYNQDGKEFITDMGQTLNNKETISYLDPPYIRTTGVYIKNQPAEIKGALAEYADPGKINQLFEPMKDSIMMFTNDINGPYFETLNTMLEGRMSKDIIGYKEGTTPTSLVTTNEIAVKPKDVGLSYYKILKDSFTKDIMKSLQEGLLPKISKQLSKHIAKFEQHFMDLMTKKFGDLTKIQDEIFKGKEAFDNLESSLDTVVSGKDKQAIIREAKKWLKENKVRGSDVIKLIDKINRLWVNKQAKAKEVRNEVDKLRKQSTIDVESKKAFFDWFNKEYTLKKVPEKRSKEVQAVDNVMTGQEFTAKELEIFEKYLKDEKFYNQIEEARKQSIYNLTIDELNTLLDTVKYYKKVGKQYREFKDQEFNQKIEQERVKAEPGLTKIESTKPLKASETIKKESRIAELGIKAKIRTKDALLDATPMEWLLDEELNLSRMAYNFIETPINKHRDYMEAIALEFDKLSKELKITKEGWKKITFHGLSRRSDGKGKIKLIARMKKAGEDPTTFSDTLTEQASDTYLTKEEKEMYDYMQSVFKDLGKQMQETKILVDNEMITLMDEYFPIQMDWASNQDKFASTIDPNTIDNGSNLFRKTKTEQGFTKEATGLEVVPELMSDKIFKTHVSNVSYYTNMQKPIKQLNQIVNTWGKDKLGDLGYKFMKDYLDVIARQGVLGVQTGFDRIVSQGVRNFQSAVLGFNPTTMALQTSAILEGVAIGGNVDLGAYKDIVKAVVGKKEIWDMVSEKSGTVRNREYRNLFGNTTDKFDKGIMEKWNKYGFYGIQKADAVLSRVLWYSEYKRSLKQGLNESDAVYNADTIIKKAMGHTHFEGKAMFVLKNERKSSSVATVFQNFVLNHSAMLRYGGGRKAQKKYGKVGGHMMAYMFAGLLFALYEELLRKGGRLVHNQQDYSSPTGKAIGQLIGFVPYAGILYGGARYSSINVLTGWKDISDGIERQDWTRIIKGLGVVMGVGGTAEFDRIYKGYIREDKKKAPPVKSLSRGTTTRKKRD